MSAQATASDNGQQLKEPAGVRRQLYWAGHWVPSGHTVPAGSATLLAWVIGRECGEPRGGGQQA